ncbi:STM3941 family protein [Carboxylicivirga sp. M1479]|uniref:STM3941 family protein n=1 Tax=Carboxylicivirga sp. M1479 TaxID=2594476 RepID=UPI00117735A2|nr:STM3941 family protein [Carboxylicivirga sp. M1479]TRX65903.1 hypothetical protein FNN09_16050 [Carboxylicivirga sp. M1479]
MKSETTEIALMRKNVIIALLGFSYFLWSGIDFIEAAQAFKAKGTMPNPIGLYICGAALILMCLPIIVRLFLMLYKGKPGLIINEEGIIDNSGIMAAGKIKWSAIKKIKANDESNMIVLKMDKPKAFIRQNSNPFLHLCFVIKWLIYGSPVAINVTALQQDITDMVNLLMDKMELYRK